MNNSPSNIFQTLLLLEIYHQNCQAVLAATGMKWFTHLHQKYKQSDNFELKSINRVLRKSFEIYTY